MQIPIKELKKRLKNNSNDCKHIRSFDNSIVAKSFFALFNKMTQTSHTDWCAEP